MNETFEKYLDKVDRCLKPLPTSDRIDIVKEIKSSILEMDRENVSTEDILERLGKPDDLAKAYLGDLLSKGKGLSWRRFLTICAFYSIVGFSGLFVIPCLGIMAPTFAFCGLIVPILGGLKFINDLLKMNIPYIEYIRVQFGSIILTPAPAFVVSIIMGIILFTLGIGLWKLLVFYCQRVSQTKSHLSI